MKIIITIILLLAGQITAIAQMPIIASKIKYKDFREVRWLTGNHIEDEKITVIEFYLDGNPTCQQIMNNVLLPMHKENPNVQIIILALQDSKKLHKIAKKHPEINIGIDEQGDVFRKLGVKYVPTSILIGEDNKMKWRGTLNHNILRSKI